MSDVINTARVLYRLIQRRPVNDEEFDRCMVEVFNLGGINDAEMARQSRDELVSSLRQQPRMPKVVKYWQKTFAREEELSETKAIEFVREVWGAIEELNIWFRPNISGGTLRYTRGAISDIHPYLTKDRPFWSLAFTVEGSGVCNCIRRELHTHPGDMILFSPTALVDLRRNDDSEHWVHHHVEFTVQSHWLRWLEWPEVGPNIYHLRLTGDSDTNKFSELIKEIISIDPRSTLFAEPLKQNLLEQFLIRCHELAQQEKGRPIDNRITRIAAYISEHYHLNFSVEHLAEIGGLSRSRLSILFKQQMGVSLLQWRDEQRIAEACRLLLDSSLHISVIAEQIGYQDPLYFGRCFRQRLGCSPSQYRTQRLVTDN